METRQARRLTCPPQLSYPEEKTWELIAAPAGQGAGNQNALEELSRMQRRAWLLRVREGKEAEYRRTHTAVWPELIEAARQAGLRNHSCFLSGRDVIVYVEAEDFETAFGHLLATDVKKRWDRAMSSILEENDSASFDEVFHFD